MKLHGNAAHVLDGGFPNDASYADLVAKFERIFGAKDQAALYRTQLKSRRRSKSETIQSSYDDINRFVLLAHPGAPTAHRNDLAVDALIEALDNDYHDMRVKDKDPTDIESAMQAALLVEAYLNNMRTDPEGNRSSIQTGNNDNQPMSKYTGRSRNVRVESSNDSENKDSDSFYRQVYENQRDKFETITNARFVYLSLSAYIFANFVITAFSAFIDIVLINCK